MLFEAIKCYSQAVALICRREKKRKEKGGRRKGYDNNASFSQLGSFGDPSGG